MEGGQWSRRETEEAEARMTDYHSDIWIRHRPVGREETGDRRLERNALMTVIVAVTCWMALRVGRV